VSGGLASKTDGARCTRDDEFTAEVLSGLSVLKTQMADLTSDGNGSRIVGLERQM
jgi:hypothetical protein